MAALVERLTAAGVSPASTAMGVDLRPGGGCVRCATCDGFPCRLGAKSDAEVCAVDPALATGSARLSTGVRVERLVTDASGRRVVEAVGVGPDGPVTVHGRRFVVSAGAANSAALLLASSSAEHPDGLGNSSGRLGRSFMMHNNAHIAAVDVNRHNDVVFQKTQTLREQVKLVFRAESYNVFNHPNLTAPTFSSLGIASSTFGVSQSQVGQNDGTTGARQIQGALKLIF